MELKDVLVTLEKSKEYLAWRKDHASSFLAHAFVMLDEENKNTWQIGYFDDAKSLMTTFVVNQGKIELIPDQEVLKAQQHIMPLKPEDVKVSIADALATAQKTKTEQYPQELPAKTFFIIQHLPEHGSVFNITYFTASFKTINIKLSTENGTVVHSTIQALAAFG